MGLAQVPSASRNLFSTASHPHGLGLCRRQLFGSAQVRQLGSSTTSLAWVQRVESTLNEHMGSANQADAADTEHFHVTKWFPPIHPTTTTLDTLTLSDFFYIWLRRALPPVFPGPLRHARRAEGRRIGGHSIPAWGKAAAETFFLRGMTAGDAPSRRASAPWLPGYHLLRLQAVREERGRRALPAPAGRPFWLQ